MDDKRVQGISADVVGKYKRELERLRLFCEARHVFSVQGLDRELLTGFAGTWEAAYSSSTTRSKVRERLRSFLRYCYEAQWLDRIPQVPKVKIDEVPTMPLSPDEYDGLLRAVDLIAPDNPSVKKRDRDRRRTRALFQLMRYSGLALEDALTLERAELVFSGIYRVMTSRQKTGVHVCVPLPPTVAQELLAVPNEDPKYFFWEGEILETLTRKWTRYRVSPAFKLAGIRDDCFATSHRLRDTFAVDLLQKGVPLEEVSKLLGHESIKTTEKSYAAWCKGRLDRPGCACNRHMGLVLPPLRNIQATELRVGASMLWIGVTVGLHRGVKVR